MNGKQVVMAITIAAGALWIYDIFTKETQEATPAPSDPNTLNQPNYFNRNSGNTIIDDSVEETFAWLDSVGRNLFGVTDNGFDEKQAKSGKNGVESPPDFDSVDDFILNGPFVGPGFAGPLQF